MSAAGFVAPLPAQAAAEMARRFPNVPLADVEREFGFYELRKADRGPAPKEARALLARMQAQAGELLVTAREVRESTALRAALRGAGGPLRADALPQLIEALEAAKVILPHASRTLAGGRRANERRVLAAAVARILAAAGEPVDARPNGALCQVLGLLLEAAGETPSNLATIARSVLKPSRAGD